MVSIWKVTYIATCWAIRYRIWTVLTGMRVLCYLRAETRQGAQTGIQKIERLSCIAIRKAVVAYATRTVRFAYHMRRYLS